MHRKSWKGLCLPKNLGGLGFRDLWVFNQALLAKKGWCLLQEPSSLLARVLKARYFPKSYFTSAFRGSNPSFSWRSIWGANSLLWEGLLRRIGNGTNVSIWKDSWIPEFEEALLPPTDKEDFHPPTKRTA